MLLPQVFVKKVSDCVHKYLPLTDEFVQQGQQAIDVIEKRKPDLLLLDLLMPHKDEEMDEN